MSKKNNIIIYILLFVLGVVVGCVGFLLYDNVINKNNDVFNEESTNNKEDNNDLSYKIVDTLINEEDFLKELYVNGKLVDFENSSYKFQFFDMKVRKFNKDILIVEGSFASSSLYVVNKDAEVIGVFGHEGGDDSIKTLPIKANYRDTYRIDGNNIYVQSDVFSNGGDEFFVCNRITNNNDIVVYEEKFEYLGNNEFSEPVIVKTITREQYMKDNNIVCD